MQIYFAFSRLKHKAPIKNCRPVDSWTGLGMRRGAKHGSPNKIETLACPQTYAHKSSPLYQNILLLVNKIENECWGLPQNIFGAPTSKMPDSAIVQNRMYLFSTLTFMLRRRSRYFCRVSANLEGLTLCSVNEVKSNSQTIWTKLKKPNGKNHKNHKSS